MLFRSRRFGGASDIVGRTVQVNGRARTVIGVMPASFRLPNDYASLRPTEAWVPEVVNPANLGAWGSRSYAGLARLKDGVSPAAASVELPLVAEMCTSREPAVSAKLPNGDVGTSRGCLLLGDAYRNGLGLLQDYVRAEELYRQACQADSGGACTRVAHGSDLADVLLVVRQIIQQGPDLLPDHVPEHED